MSNQMVKGNTAVVIGAMYAGIPNIPNNTWTHLEFNAYDGVKLINYIELGGKVDAIVLTGGIAYSGYITSEIASMVQFIAPVEIYGGENELESLAENGYGILSGEFEVNWY